MSDVRLSAKRNPGLGWKLYDEQLRLRKAVHPESSWGFVDMELWLMYMVNSNNNVANVNDVSPGYRSGSVNMNLSRRLKCYEFNYEGKCSKQVCQYSHLCIHCNGGHPMIFCQTGQFSTTVGFRQPWSLRQQFVPPRVARSDSELLYTRNPRFWHQQH